MFTLNWSSLPNRQQDCVLSAIFLFSLVSVFLITRRWVQYFPSAEYLCRTRFSSHISAQGSGDQILSFDYYCFMHVTWSLCASSLTVSTAKWKKHTVLIEHSSPLAFLTTFLPAEKHSCGRRSAWKGWRLSRALKKEAVRCEWRSATATRIRRDRDKNQMQSQNTMPSHQNIWWCLWVLWSGPAEFSDEGLIELDESKYQITVMVRHWLVAKHHHAALSLFLQQDEEESMLCSQSSLCLLSLLTPTATITLLVLVSLTTLAGREEGCNANVTSIRIDTVHQHLEKVAVVCDRSNTKVNTQCTVNNLKGHFTLSRRLPADAI